MLHQLVVRIVLCRAAVQIARPVEHASAPVDESRYNRILFWTFLLHDVSHGTQNVKYNRCALLNSTDLTRYKIAVYSLVILKQRS